MSLSYRPRPAPLTRPTTVLTPRGAVAAQIVRLEYELADLPAEDRAFCLALVRELLESAGRPPRGRGRPADATGWANPSRARW